MKTGDIKSASECPSNEGVACFCVGTNLANCGCHSFIVGRIDVDWINVGYNEYHDTTIDEMMVFVYDEDDNKRASFPRRNALLEYHVEENKGTP